MNYNGTITLDGKQYQVSVIDGEKFIDGMDVDKFIDSLMIKGDINAVNDLIEIGKQAVTDIETGTKKETYQSMANEKHQQRNN